MANRTIDDFSAVVAPAVTDTLLVTQSGLTKKETLAQVDTLLSATAKTLTNKTLTSPVINTAISGTAIDTDGTLAANSDTKAASQKAIKTYADTKQTLATALTALAALTPEADKVPYFTSATQASSSPVTSFAWSLLDDANAAAIIATLGAGVIPYASLSTSATEALNVAKRTAKAWVLFGPDGTIYSDFNVSSITDNGTGDWTVLFSANMTDDDYAFSIMTYANAATSLPGCVAAPTVSALRVRALNSAMNLADPTTISVIVFGN